MMDCVRKISSAVKKIGIRGCLKSIYFNFRYFPLREAFYLPVLMAGNVFVSGMKCGNIKLWGGVKTGVLRIGLYDDMVYYAKPCFLNVRGNIILEGHGFHVISPGAMIRVDKDAILTIGNNYSASHDLKLYCRKKITIGEDNMWSNNITVMDNDGHYIYNQNGVHTNYNSEVVFGNHVWVACRCIITKGSMIPNGCIIGAGSLVNKTLINDNSIYAGNPIREIKQNVKWSRRLV